MKNEDGEEEEKQPVKKTENEDEDEEEKERQRIAEPLVELERLAVLVKALMHDCAVVPKGSFKLTPNHELRSNPQWVFVPAYPTEADPSEHGLNDWLHFRYVDSKEKRNLMNLGESIFRDDFLDTLERDLPLGQWSVQRS